MSTLFKSFIGAALIGLIFSFVTTAVLAQTLVRETVEEQTTIVNENLQIAKLNALSNGKRNAVQRVLQRQLSEEQQQQAASLIEKSILDNVDRYIESVRIVRESVSDDVAFMNIELEVTIFLNQLLGYINQQLSGADKRKNTSITLLYDPDDFIWTSANRTQLQTQLKNYLESHQLSLHRTQPMAKSWLQTVQSSPDQPLPDSINRAHPRTKVLLDLAPNQLPQKSPSKLMLMMNVYHSKTGKWVDRLQTVAGVSSQNEDLALKELLVQVQLKDNHFFQYSEFQPGKSGSTVRLHLKGLDNPSHYQEFINHQIQTNPNWNQLQVVFASKDASWWEGNYYGSVSALPGLIQNNLPEGFRLLKHSGANSQIELDLRHVEAGAPLVAYQSNSTNASFLNELPEGWQTPSRMTHVQGQRPLYDLPRNVLVYDYLRTRGESGYFKVDLNSNTSSVKIAWRRAGPSSLSPRITILDENKRPIAQEDLNNRRAYTLEKPVPSGNSALYIRISDKHGYMENDVGGFQFLHYVFSVSTS